jgi:hypothetical protein
VEGSKDTGIVVGNGLGNGNREKVCAAAEEFYVCRGNNEQL